MGAEVQSGAAVVSEHPRATGSAAMENPKNTGARKQIVIVAIIGILCLAGVLIGIFSDWSGPDGNADEGSTTPGMFESTMGPFNVSVPLFSADITKGYETMDEAKIDFEQMAKFLLNGGITSNSAARNIAPPMYNPPIDLDGGAEAPTAAAGTAAAPAPAPMVGDDATDYETNNQEANVDKADIAKSNGEYLFTAYSDYLLVMEVASGKIIDRIQMDAIEFTNDCDPNMFYPADDTMEDESIANETTVAGEAVTNSSSSTATTRSSVIWHPCWYHPKPYIQALALAGGRLTVVVSGYGVEHTQDLDVQPTLRDYLGTRILVYDINGGDMILLSTKDVNGSFRNAYTIGGYTHVVTQARLNTWDHLLEPIQRWQPAFEGLSDEDYVTEATRLAKEELIPKFVDQLTLDIQVSGVDLSLVRLSLFTNAISGHGKFERSMWSGGYANSLTHIVSFDMNEPEAFSDELSISIEACFLPSSWGYVYSNDEMLFVAGQGWDWNVDRRASGQTTYLVGFELYGASSKAKVTGSVPGYLLSPYSLDFYKGHLRVATTQNFRTFTMFDMAVAEDGEEVNTNDEMASLTENQIIILKVPAATSIENENILGPVGSVKLGKKDEIFTAVRFFDNVAYAVTFERTDPFYVLDLSKEDNPVVLGALEIPGFSSYLHSINKHNTELLAVGQHANDDGVVLGLKISLFDATDPVNPQLIYSHIEEEQENAYSYSAVEWEPEAFRYLNMGDYGRLIIPMSLYVWDAPKPEEPDFLDDGDLSGTTATTTISNQGSFDGFGVFSVANSRIERQFYISHEDQSVEFTAGCWSCGWLSARSFVYNGDVVTMKGHTILRTDLDTGAGIWDTNVDDTNAGLLECCGYGY